MIYDYHCVPCATRDESGLVISYNWTRSIRRDINPGTVVCDDCATGREIQPWRKRPDHPFVPPETAHQKFGPLPFEYTPTPAELEARRALQAKPAPVYAPEPEAEKKDEAPAQKELEL